MFAIFSRALFDGFNSEISTDKKTKMYAMFFVGDRFSKINRKKSMNFV